MFKIDKNIPLPPHKRAGGKTPKGKYPFRKMQIGDSFLYPEPENNRAERLRIGALIINSARSSGIATKKMKFTTRRVKDGIRCWRIK